MRFLNTNSQKAYPRERGKKSKNIQVFKKDV